MRPSVSTKRWFDPATPLDHETAHVRQSVLEAMHRLGTKEKYRDVSALLDELVTPALDTVLHRHLRTARIDVNASDVEHGMLFGSLSIALDRHCERVVEPAVIAWFLEWSGFGSDAGDEPAALPMELDDALDRWASLIGIERRSWLDVAAVYTLADWWLSPVLAGCTPIYTPDPLYRWNDPSITSWSTSIDPRRESLGTLLDRLTAEYRIQEQRLRDRGFTQSADRRTRRDADDKPHDHAEWFARWLLGESKRSIAKSSDVTDKALRLAINATRARVDLDRDDPPDLVGAD